MVRQSVYFRNLHGKKSSKDNAAPLALLERFGTAARLENDSLSWAGIDYHQFQVALRPSFIVLDPNGDELVGEDAWNIVGKAPYSSRRKPPRQSHKRRSRPHINGVALVRFNQRLAQLSTFGGFCLDIAPCCSSNVRRGISSIPILTSPEH
jgi:hypothetical protein